MRLRHIGLAVVLLVGACGDDDGPPATTVPSGSVATSDTSASTTSTTVPFDVEVRRAAVDLMLLRNEIYQAPDPARVAEYALPGCSCFERERAILQTFVDEGTRWSVAGVEPLGIRIVDPNPHAPAMVLIARQLDNPIVDAAGDVVRVMEGSERVAFIVAVDREGLDSWRYVELGANPGLLSEVAEAIVQEGLP